MFNISIEQKVLAKALEYLEPTVGKNSTGLGDNCICMKTTGSGSVELYTTNTVEFTKLEAIVAVGGNTQDTAPLVDFKRFKAIIGSIPSNEVVSLEASVNDLLINFALKPTPIQLVGCNNGIIPLPTNSFPSNTMISVSKSFIKHAVDNVTSIITESAAAPIYNCMRIFATNMDIEVTALDMTGKRTFVQTGTSTSNNPTQDILIEASKLKKSMKLFEDFNEMDFYMDANMVKIDAADPVSQLGQKTNGMIDGISYYSRRLNGAFPSNIKANFSPIPTEFSEINKEELTNCLARAKALEDQTSGGTIGFEISGNNVRVTLNSAYGNLEDSIIAENAVSKTFRTVFKYTNLGDIMKVIGTDTFEIGILPNHPTNYVIKSKGSNDVMFTIPGMIGATSTNATP